MKNLFLKFFTIIGMICIMQQAYANSLCSEECSFDTFFRNNYQNLLQHMCLQNEEKKIFDTLFNAYSIKFQGLDYEYENICISMKQNEDCAKEKKKYLISLSTIAIDEYDSFLDDLSFETCGTEGLENPIIKKNKRKYRKQLKKLISKHCR